MEETHIEMYSKLLRVNNYISAIMQELFKATDITRSQFNVLKTLGEVYPNSCNAKYIKDNMLVNEPDVTRLIDRLVLKGLITRDRNTEKRRQIDVKITKKGIKVLEEVGPKALEAVLFVEKISTKEAKQVSKILDKLIE